MTPVPRVMNPVMVISLQGGKTLEKTMDVGTNNRYHCQGSKPPVLTCRMPKLRNPMTICAGFGHPLRCCSRRRVELSLTYQFRSSRLCAREIFLISTARQRRKGWVFTPVAYSKRLLLASVKHTRDNHKASRDGALAST